jgi:hypothetical protein
VRGSADPEFNRPIRPGEAMRRERPVQHCSVDVLCDNRRRRGAVRGEKRDFVDPIGDETMNEVLVIRRPGSPHIIIPRLAACSARLAVIPPAARPI